METQYCVYCHTSPSGKRYIGITSQKPNNRWCGGSGYKYNTHFWSAIQKYGWGNFTHDILKIDLTLEEASEIEKRLINEFQTRNPKYGYNISEGGYGGGHPTSEETKRLISEIKRGKPCPEHQKRLLAKINKGKIPTNLEAIHKSNQKRVKQFDISGNYISTYPSIRIAGRECNIGENGIGLCCRGINQTAGGYVWRFAV